MLIGLLMLMTEDPVVDTAFFWAQISFSGLQKKKPLWSSTEVGYKTSPNCAALK